MTKERWDALYSTYADELNERLRAMEAAKLQECVVPEGLAWKCETGAVKIISSTVRLVRVCYIQGFSIERAERCYVLERSDGQRIEIPQTALLRRLARHGVWRPRPWWRRSDDANCPPGTSPV